MHGSFTLKSKASIEQSLALSSTCRWDVLMLFSLQHNMHSLQLSVDSLLKEKEDLVLALQSAKKDTQHAK